MKHTIVIAEVGGNHNGSLYIAKRLVNEAADYGADIVRYH